jgi:pyruvate/2-oxoglutarate dehydrogenase complex dihydrolipoamide dehydrogenase (E3) component
MGWLILCGNTGAYRAISQIRTYLPHTTRKDNGIEYGKIGENCRNHGGDMKKAYDTPQESISYAKNTQGDGFIVQGATLKGVRHTPWTKQVIERKIAELESLAKREQCPVCKDRGVIQLRSLKPYVAIFEKCGYCEGAGSIDYSSAKIGILRELLGEI